MFNEDEDIRDLRYLFIEDEDVDEDVDEDESKTTHKESPFKSIIVDIRNKLSKNGNKLIKKGLCYAQKIKSLGSAELKISKRN